MGFTSLFLKFKLPGWFIMTLAHVAVFFGNIYSYLSGKYEVIVPFKGFFYSFVEVLYFFY